MANATENPPGLLYKPCVDTIAGKLAANIEAIKRRPPQFELSPGLLENRLYAQAGVPAYSYGPGLLSVSHGPAEYVVIAELYNCAAIYVLTALDMLAEE